MPQTLPSQALEHIPDHVLDKHPEFADVLAVAFTDQNGNHTYEPGTDTLIASLLDINNDHVVSVGDRIHWGTYPTTFDVNGPRGNFTGPDELVTSVEVANSFQVSVQTALGFVVWVDQPTGKQQFETGNATSNFSVSLGDVGVGDPRDTDHIFVDPGQQGPGHPDTPASIALALPGNEGFLDVLILI
jgi:hypothetical protein